MQDNKLLYRIIRGRLRFVCGDLLLYIYEPSSELIDMSYDVYEDDYNDSYLSGVYIDCEKENLLIEHDIWNPHRDKEIESINSEIEELKVQCFEKFYNKRELIGLKRKIGVLNKKYNILINQKNSMSHLTCSGSAEKARSLWIISKTTFYPDGRIYDWVNLDLNDALNYYIENQISIQEIRSVARSDTWRSMWSISKKSGNLFDRPVVDYTRDQIALCSYSVMYDNIYEHPNAPSEDIINDDDCLDGWMIKQKRENEKDKKKKTIDGTLTNERIRNSKEVMIMADNEEEARSIFELNDAHSRAIIKQRDAIIQEKGKAKDVDFIDVQTELQARKNQMFKDKFKGRK